MHVAIAGAGDLAKYFVEELLAAGHSVVMLTRSEKDWFQKANVNIRITDYSVAMMVEQLQDCDAIVSTIADYSMNNVTVHLAILEACKQSPKCKHFIPSEFAANLDDFPLQPAFYVDNHQPIRDALAAQSEVIYTLLSPGWLMDYLVPAKLRYIRDIGILHPLDLTANILAIPGTGNEPITFTSARDFARALAALISQSDWEPTTYVAGETLSWHDLVGLLAKHGMVPKKSYRPVQQIQDEISKNADEMEVLAAQFDMWSVSGGATMPVEKTARQAKKYFSKLHLRTVEEFLTAADAAQEGSII